MELTSNEIRELIEKQSGVQIQGEIRRIQFEHSGTPIYFKMQEETKHPKQEQAQAPTTFELRIYYTDNSASTILFGSRETLKNAFDCYMRSNRYKIEALINGQVEGRYSPKPNKEK